LAEARTDIAPAGWQVTATTLYCDMVDENVTIMVNRDWSCRCTWWSKYKSVAQQDPRHKFGKQLKVKIGQCRGPDCDYVLGYRDKLIAEETAIKK